MDYISYEIVIPVMILIVAGFKIYERRAYIKYCRQVKIAAQLILMHNLSLVFVKKRKCVKECYNLNVSVDEAAVVFCEVLRKRRGGDKNEM